MNVDVFGVPTEERSTEVSRPRSRRRKENGINKVYNWMNLFAYTAMVAVNILANALPLGGATSGQVSDRYPTLFTPTGMTFSIWGIIYVLLGIVVIRQLISRKREHQIITGNVAGLFASSCALNIGWIFSWHFGQITGATLLILVLLINLILIMGLVRFDRLMSAAFGIYTAWIIVASMASIFIQAVYNGSNMISATGEVFAALAIVAAGCILMLVSLTTRNWTFVAVGIWSFTGIIVRQAVQYRSRYTLVMGAALLMMVLQLLVLTYMIYTERSRSWIEAGSISAAQSPGALPG